MTMRDKHDVYRNTNFAKTFPEVEELTPKWLSINIMQLATATLAGKGVFANNPTVVEWGNSTI